MTKKKKQLLPDRAVEIHRFLRILRSIRNGDYPNKLTLSRDLDCTPRTIQHYTVLLRELGAPLEFDRDRNGFYFTREWYL